MEWGNGGLSQRIRRVFYRSSTSRSTFHRCALFRKDSHPDCKFVSFHLRRSSPGRIRKGGRGNIAMGRTSRYRVYYNLGDRLFPYICYIFGRIRLGRTLMITSQSRTVHVDFFRDTRFHIKVIKDLRPSSLRYINYNYKCSRGRVVKAMD